MSWQPDYTDLATAQAWLRKTPVEDPGEPDADDNIISMAITAASRAIDRSAGRQFGLTDIGTEMEPIELPTRKYTARYDWARRAYIVDIDDLMTSEGLAVTSDGTVVDEANMTMLPLNATSDGRPWTAILFGATVSCLPGRLEVVARFGWADVPAVVSTACLIQVARWWKRRDAPFGVAGSPDIGSEIRLLAKLDPDVNALLAGVRRFA